MTMPRSFRDERGGVRGRVAGGVAVAVAALGLLARATLADSSGGASYRTATATRATVVQTLNRAGTIEPVAQATVAFPTSGAVAAVAVKAGETVTTGQVLASLDTTAMADDLAARQATLAATELTLDQAVNGQVTATAGSTGGAAQSSVTGSRSTTTTVAAARASATRGSTTTSTGTADGLAPAQQAVLSGQKQVDADLATAERALKSASAACAAPAASATTTTRPDTTTTTTTVAAAVTTTTVPRRAAAPVAATSGLGTAACMAAQQQALDAQQTLAESQRVLGKAETVLDDSLGRAASAAAAASGGSTSGGSSSPTGASPSTGGSPTATQPVVSAATLVADQAAVDAADAVRVASQAMDQATVVSPIAGTVAAVSLVPGQQVSAASSVANVIVVGDGGWEVSTTVGVDDVDKVKTGQAATVVPDGTSTPLEARVVSVGVAGLSSGGTTAYPVVIGFTGSPPGLRNGASATVAIELARSTDALTVPTSAVRTVGDLHVVTVPAGGTTRVVPIHVGTVGADLTEVMSGLSAGQEVVLANLDQPLPASNTTTNTGGGLGGLGGGAVRAGGGGRTG